MFGGGVPLDANTKYRAELIFEDVHCFNGPFKHFKNTLSRACAREFDAVKFGKKRILLKLKHVDYHSGKMIFSIGFLE